jgi:hypothetical protein
MILAVIILAIMVVAALEFALLCYLHYHIIRKQFECYRRTMELRFNKEKDKYNFLYNLSNELEKIIINKEVKI